MAVFHMLLQALAHSIRLFGRVRFANIARFHLRRHGVKKMGEANTITSAASIFSRISVISSFCTQFLPLR